MPLMVGPSELSGRTATWNEPRAVQAPAPSPPIGSSLTHGDQVRSRLVRRRALLKAARASMVPAFVILGIAIGRVIGHLGEDAARVPAIASTAQPVRWVPPAVQPGVGPLAARPTPASSP